MKIGDQIRAFRQRKHYLLAAFGAFVVGLLLLSFSHVFVTNSVPELVTKEIGSIFIGLSVIGVAVDLAFRSELAKDVFQTAFGYLLHPDLRDEVRWIYGLEVLVTDYHHEIEIERIPDENDWVLVRETICRTYNAIGSKTVELVLGGGVDEYLRANRPSRIVSATVVQGETRLTIGQGITVKQKSEDGRPIISFETDAKIPIEPSKPVTVLWVVEAPKWHNDELTSFFGSASKGAHVTIKAPPDFVCTVGFATRDTSLRMKHLGDGRYRLDAVLLPLQAIRAHWSLKDANSRP